MAIPPNIRAAVGSWKGKSKLNLPWLPPEKQVSESASQLHVDTDDHGTIATITYVWHYEGKRHEGTFLLAGSETGKKIEIGWVDSWHQSSGVMHCTGARDDADKIKTKGTYSAGTEVWGWTISLEATKDAFKVEMENVTPQGEATWAVRGEYQRE